LENSIKKDFEDAMKMKAAIDDEERIFQSYAEKCIAEWKDNVRD